MNTHEMITDCDHGRQYDLICKKCKGKGYVWVEYGAGEVEKVQCDCQ